jgi:hypothetical protein
MGMKNINNMPDPKTLQMRYVTGELKGLRKVIEYLWDGEQEAFNALFFMKSNYKQWPDMLRWLAHNRIKGEKLVELMQNESPDGGGYHLGCSKIISMMEGIRFNTRMIKGDELL